VTAWADVHANLRADGINLKWIGNDDRVWHIGGMLAGAQGAIIIPPVKGMVHVPFKSIWHEPAYGAPRFERTIDERREITTKVALFVDDPGYGWFDVESRWWNGMDGDTPGWFCVATRKYGELYVPMQLLESVETELEDDPFFDGMQVWDIVIAADGEPRWRQPDIRATWTNDMSTTAQVKRDDELLAPNITVGVGRFRLANRGTRPAWPILTLSAPKTGRTPARYWISDGNTTRMLRVPPLNKGEHIIVDTNPENRIAISAIDPVDDWTKQILRNAELLRWLFGQYGDSGISVLERFHGQGFETPIPPRTVANLTVYASMPGAKVSVRLPQRFERAIS
jgi:hypothetical protein